MKRLMLVSALLVAGAWAHGRPADGGQATWSDLRRDPAIQYDARPTHDPVADLDNKLQQGIARLTFDAAGQGYLRSFLDALDSVKKRIRHAQTLAESSLQPVALLLTRDIMWEE